jgi:hypothetical protein
MGIGSDGRSYIITGTWDPIDPSFQVLNTETPKGQQEDNALFMHVQQN